MFKFRDGFLLVFLLEKGANSEMGYLEIYGWGQRMAALLSSSILRSEVGHAMDIFVDITSSIEAIILSLLFCRSGLIFLLLHPELSATVILALRGVDDFHKEDCAPLRYASILISKGFFCRPREVGLVVEMHLRVVNAVDRLLSSTPQSEEFLWVLWELCGLSRSDSGRQALLALGHFPELFALAVHRNATINEVWDSSLGQGGWNLRFARDSNDWELDLIGALFNMLRDFKISQEEDSVVWRGGGQGTFGVRHAYNLLAAPNTLAFPVRCIWVDKVPTKTAFFAWEATWGKILTLDRLKNEGDSFLIAVFCVVVKRKM
ncbi:hypothetical protein CK203_070194 [Vitis vinifera]|uniref:Reverse transcriptase zinc-binding domain-containing protein n=1 Tax=Vitis vinifera TaxID=29760 RepID=A0A438EHM8_VITVI|nr:hypothetical protein CK203_070194 [Vitis vinifera]